MLMVPHFQVLSEKVIKFWILSDESVTDDYWYTAPANLLFSLIQSRKRSHKNYQNLLLSHNWSHLAFDWQYNADWTYGAQLFAALQRKGGTAHITPSRWTRSTRWRWHLGHLDHDLLLGIDKGKAKVETRRYEDSNEDLEWKEEDTPFLVTSSKWIYNYITYHLLIYCC